MKTVKTVQTVLSLSLFTLFSGLIVAQAAESKAPAKRTPKTAEAPPRIGVYDSRSVAAAYCGSARHEAQIQRLDEALRQARSSGNAAQIRLADDAVWEARKRLHRQGFGTYPVDNLLEQIPNDVARIKEELRLTALVSKWDESALAKHKKAEKVNVTEKLIDAFKPAERQRRNAIEIQKQEPIPTDQLETLLKKEGDRQALARYETVPVTRGPLTMVILEGGQLTPFAGDPAQWQVDATLPETSVRHIEVGQEVDCQADAYPGRVFKGEVIRIADAPKPGSQPATYHAVVQVTNPGLKFRDGMSVRLAFILAHRADALRIPVQALSFRLSGHATVSTDLLSGLSPNELAMPDAAERAVRTVWVMRGKNEPEPVRIRIGITDNAFTEVTSGLREGERVIIGKTSLETQADD